MAAERSDSKANDLEMVTMDAARDGLTDLVLRAGMRDERIVLTRNGKAMAALVGLQDLDKLQALDGAA